MSNKSFSLGNVDQGSMPADPKLFLSRFHKVLNKKLQDKVAFRDEPNGIWRKFAEIPGNDIRNFQQFLKDAGFMPNANVDGIFGYATQAAARLFQEYIRSVDGETSIGVPDGLVGQTTLGFVEKWKTERQGKPDFVCQWGSASLQNGTPEFNTWISLLTKAKESYTQSPNPILQFSEKYPKPSDTRKIKDWDTSPNSIHLIGIRRNESARVLKRENDDLFVLLVRGMVFKFWGSTDPNQAVVLKEEKPRRDEPFLIEGQHAFKFGWHKISNDQQVYRALKPANLGVLVFRDWDNDDALTAADIARGLDPNPNGSINIHWSGKGGSNYSAGCQVIAGQSYSNHLNHVIDCSSFASPGYKELGSKMTRGAYNVFTDLLLSYAPIGTSGISYTLARDESFLNIEGLGGDILAGWFSKLQDNEGVV